MHECLRAICASQTHGMLWKSRKGRQTIWTANVTGSSNTINFIFLAIGNKNKNNSYDNARQSSLTSIWHLRFLIQCRIWEIISVNPFPKSAVTNCVAPRWLMRHFMTFLQPNHKLTILSHNTAMQTPKIHQIHHVLMWFDSLEASFNFRCRGIYVLIQYLAWLRPLSLISHQFRIKCKVSVYILTWDITTTTTSFSQPASDDL